MPKVAEAPEPEPEDERPDGPVRLGDMFRCAADVGEACLMKAEEAAQARRRGGGIQDVKGLFLQPPGGDGLDGRHMEQRLPEGDLPAPCRRLLASWAWGRVGGHRCLLEVASLVAAPSAPVRGVTPGRATWPALLALCGLAGGGELLAGAGVRAEVFAKAPSNCLHQAFSAVGAEAGVRGPVTFEELHLGLRSLELGARNAEDGGPLLRAAAWRELLRAHLEGLAARPMETEEGPAEALARALELGAEGLEREARLQPLEELRSLPSGWDLCRTLLASMVRNLRKSLEDIQTYGPYAVLGVGCDASDAEIKRAYRDMCLRHHPDKGGDTATFQALQQAHDKIIEDRKRGLRPAKPEAAEPHPRSASRENPGPRPAPRRERSTEGAGPWRGSSETDAPRREPSSGMPSPPRPPRSRSPAPERASREHADRCGDPEQAAADVLREVERLHSLAADGSERAQAASAAIEVAVTVIGQASCCEGKVEDHLAAREAAHGLVSAMHAVAEGAEAVAEACTEASTKVVTIGVLGASGERAEAVVDASLQCATTAAAATRAATSCASLAEELVEALRAAEEEEEDLAAADLGPDGVAAMALKLLAAAARRGQEVAAEAIGATRRAASAVAGALTAARAAAPRGTSAATASPSQRRGRAPPAASPGPASPQGEPGAAEEEGAQEGQQGSGADEPGAATASPSSPEAAAGRPPKRPPVPPGASPGPAAGDAGQHSCPPSGGSGRPRARSGSVGRRGRNEALLRRRVEAFEELASLNSEACKLQQQLLKAVSQSPLLLPGTSRQQKARVFEVAAELLQEVVGALRLRREEPAVDLLAWLPGHGRADCALHGAGAGALHLAALLDVEALRSVLQEQFLPALCEARPDESAAVTAAVARAVEALTAWVAAKPS